MLDNLRPSEYTDLRAAALPIFGRLDGEAAVEAFGLTELLEPHCDLEDPRPVLAFLEAQGYHGGRTDVLGRFALTGPRPDWSPLPERRRVVAGYPVDAKRCVVAGLAESTDVVVDVPGIGALLLPDPFEAGLPADPADPYLTQLEFTAESAVPLVSTPQATEFSDDVIARTRLGIAAEILGVCDRLLDDVIAYVRTRHQFGQSIGSFQAIQHILAWAAADRYQLACLLDHAVMKAVAGHNDPATARAVKAMAGRVGHAVVQAVTQATGAISFTWEYSVNERHRRILTLDAIAGSSADLVAAIGREIRSGDTYPELLELADLV
ncbi:acyl-CoA dehydrogenase family protein [Nocardia bovistercoris]|uniref:Acyl-CoA dehydrogenase/oxidase C-terminal domain-containing protein n=1 Tax=Nocardia bovistercoris TaxID=2785916 RepID=A0A931IG25_9NOCA|nr:acyl-CoA dehydrogenase family protein [Nocardia bovistercoris]MBH0779761.1 hypothetical protein [Nocardia bovistercoris]